MGASSQPSREKAAMERENAGDTAPGVESAGAGSKLVIRELPGGTLQ